MDVVEKVKTKMHGVTDRQVVVGQGMTKWMNKPSGYPAQNPIGDYYGGKGKSVMKSMAKTYGKKKAKQVFYATANKRKG